jgi:hypothetical protein
MKRPGFVRQYVRRELDWQGSHFFRNYMTAYDFCELGFVLHFLPESTLWSLCQVTAHRY